MSPVEQRAAGRLNPALADVLLQRAAYGRAKYGQSLDDNEQPLRQKIPHLMQELLDAVCYAEWAGLTGYAYLIAEIANDLHDDYTLPTEELLKGGKQ